MDATHATVTSEEKGKMRAALKALHKDFFVSVVPELRKKVAQHVGEGVGGAHAEQATRLFEGALWEVFDRLYETYDLDD